MTTAPSPEMTQLRVEHVEAIAEGTTLFELRAMDARPLGEFTAGAHVAIRVPNGSLRKYSLCNDPAERDRYVIAVKREQPGSGGTNSLIDATKVGDLLPVSAPHNDFPLTKNGAGYIFIAGGIGITPILSMVRHLKSTGGGRFKLYYLTRSPEMTAFGAELSGPEFAGQVKIHHDGGDPAKSLDLWPVLERPKSAHLYCCGPRPLMENVRDMTGHWSAAAVHFESFTEGNTAKPDDHAFSVRLARSGQLVEVPAGKTILETLRAHGCVVPSSCESGTCGTCRTRLLGGEADHRDFVLSERERGDNIMVCVSRALSPEIVIDR